MPIIDISPPITPTLAVWPGDTPPSREVLLDLANGASVTLSTLRATAHLGAHADAPSHYSQAGADIASMPLDRYLGPCQVVRVEAGRGTVLRPGDLPGEITSERVLFATGTFPEPGSFNPDFAALSAELVVWLHARGVRLVGVDTPSVDPCESKDLPAHHACLRHGIAILEGLVLREVPAGEYELIALPLRLVGFDASPVRAVLRTARGRGDVP